jgi:hypothetical protein
MRDMEIEILEKMHKSKGLLSTFYFVNKKKCNANRKNNKECMQQKMHVLGCMKNA